jgi:ketosteroid isomerase-like protein
VNKEWIKSYYTTYNSGDAAALRKFYADAVVLTSAAGEIRGAQAMVDTYQFITSQFVDQMTPTSILLEGNRAAVEITDVFTAKQDVADFLGRSLKQGESFTLQLCGIYEFADDQLQRITLYQR